MDPSCPTAADPLEDIPSPSDPTYPSKHPKRPSPIAAFFETYPNFHNDRTASAGSEYKRLCRFMGWTRDDPEEQAAYADFKDALVMQFNVHYGTDAEDVRPWQALCEAIGITPVPRELKDAREAVFNTHVNLVDLTEAHTTLQKVRTFATERELAQYTKRTAKYMPGRSPLMGGVLRALLRFITHPPENDLKRDQYGRYVKVGEGGGRSWWDRTGKGSRARGGLARRVRGGGGGGGRRFVVGLQDSDEGVVVDLDD
ncbi:hypothetical protein D9611_005935 [Ephemerocybe angulata]|uniref:Uncharacterized protein n=1 Tax=Ephemerocybe angulata TaxID=980116 RepID=A0A8H5FLC2_9AGAR|nr:hypothetical protein D9611_005935 [Tulosesus angulatus]